MDNDKLTKMEDWNHQLLDDLKKNSFLYEGESLVELKCNIDLIERKLQLTKNIEEVKFGNLSSDSDFVDVAQNSFYLDLCHMFWLSREIIQSINHSLDVGNVKSDLADILLNVVWNVASDCLNFVVSPSLSGSVTCHNWLPIVSSGFDPPSLVSHVILIGKKLVQDFEVLKNTLHWNLKVRLKEMVNRFMFSIIWTYIRLNLFWTQWWKWMASAPDVQPQEVVLVVNGVRPRSKWKMVHLVSEDDQTRSAREKTMNYIENKLSNTSRSTDTKTDPTG